MLSASSRSRSPRKQMAADENKMADSSDRPTPHHATMYDQSYHTREFSRNIWFTSRSRMFVGWFQCCEGWVCDCVFCTGVIDDLYRM